jgi:hypothetical protein
MPDIATKPSLSVVISTRAKVSDVIPKVGNLLRQVQAIDGELIVISGAVEDDDAAPSGIRVHRIPGASIFDCRAAAFSVVSADIVALTEDHCVHPEGWCARILRTFSARSRLVMLGGAVVNGSNSRIEDLMNYWMTFATFAPNQVTARHPCVAQFIVKAPALERPLKPGGLESAIIQKFEGIPGAIYVDPELRVRHDQSHGFFNTFVVHFHNGRATAGFSPRRVGNRNLAIGEALYWSWKDSKAHFQRSRQAFRAGNKSTLATAAYLSMILPLILTHGIGEFVGYHKGPGQSPYRLV